MAYVMFPEGVTSFSHERRQILPDAGGTAEVSDAELKMMLRMNLGFKPIPTPPSKVAKKEDSNKTQTPAQPPAGGKPEQPKEEVKK